MTRPTPEEKVVADCDKTSYYLFKRLSGDDSPEAACDKNANVMIAGTHRMLPAKRKYFA
jgi:hypothetical protein